MSSHVSNLRIPGLRDSVPGAAYKRGDVIGQKYEVYGILGQGGFGIVYLVYSHELKGALALKTFRDEFLADTQSRERFHKEASVWVDLERHPYLVRAYLAQEIAGRLFIATEYVAPNQYGLNTLDGYLRHKPPDLTQSLRWAIQFCYGMEHAYSKGVRCHRDIKPANVMTTQDGAVKIADFGLAGAFDMRKAAQGIRLSIQHGTVGLSCQTMEGTGFGTPTYMPPEQFTDAASCDERSDIYSFGVVLFQMASGGRLPFLAQLPEDGSDAESGRFWREMHRLHSTVPVPSLDSLLFPLIQRCTAKEPSERYPSFRALRDDLQPLLERQAGEVVRVPVHGELDSLEWHLKGYSLGQLGRHEEAVRCYDEALALSPIAPVGWRNKARALLRLGRHKEALACCDRSLALDEARSDTWDLKATCLTSLGRSEEAVRCIDRALQLDPANGMALYNRGVELSARNCHVEAVRYYTQSAECAPHYAPAWNNMGISLSLLGRHQEAIRCYEKVLAIDRCQAGTWCSMGLSLSTLGRDEHAVGCFDKALSLDGRSAIAWYNKALCLYRMGRCVEALPCYERATEIDSSNADAWNERGACLGALGRYSEAIPCLDRAIELDSRNAAAYFIKGMTLEALDRKREAVQSYKQSLKAGADRVPELAEDARRRILDLEGG